MPKSEPITVKTEDGYQFIRQPDGSYSDGDLTFGSLSELYASHPPADPTPDDSQPWYEALLKQHPPPWTYKPHAAECGNGSRIDVIEDRLGNTVAGSYGMSWTVFHALWAWYESMNVEAGSKIANAPIDPESIGGYPDW